MKDFDNSYLSIISSEEATAFWLVDLEIDTGLHLYLSTLDIDIMVDGSLYRGFGFKVDPISASLGMAVDKVKMDFSNVNLEMSATLMNYNIKKRPAVVSQGVMDGYTPIVEPLFNGIVSNWSIDEMVAEIGIVNYFVHWNKRTLRYPEEHCRWPFKGTECGYVGSETKCNKTHNRCIVLENSDNFGGFRFFPAMEEKEIWWGKKPV